MQPVHLDLHVPVGLGGVREPRCAPQVRRARAPRDCSLIIITITSIIIMISISIIIIIIIIPPSLIIILPGRNVILPSQIIIQQA